MIKCPGGADDGCYNEQALSAAFPETLLTGGGLSYGAIFNDRWNQL